MRLRIKLAGGLAVVAALLGGGGVGTAGADVPHSSGPLPYSALAAGWWKWALEAPTATNPLIDDTGAKCATGQPGAILFFLAGLPAGGTGARSCDVPRNRALFFPVINLLYGAFLNDPEPTRTVDFARQQVACEAGAQTSVTIDGRPLPSRQIVHERSIVFKVQLPADNIFGLTPDVATDLVFSPTVDQGDYVLLAPLRHGVHTIHFVGTYPSVPDSACTGATIDMTYTLRVA